MSGDQPGGSEAANGATPQTTKAQLGLRELILGGEFEPGERLAELRLVERLGVSRTPLRLALVALEHEGLVEAHPTSGFVVRAFSRRDVLDAIELRGVLEGHAARRAAERHPSAGELGALRSCVADLDALLDSAVAPSVDLLLRYVELNERFHEALVGLADSPVVTRAVDQAVALPFASPSAFVHAQGELPQARRILTVAQEQHRAMAEAIAGGEGSRAEHVAREHARIAASNLECALRDRSALHAVPGASLVRLAEGEPVDGPEDRHAL